MSERVSGKRGRPPKPKVVMAMDSGKDGARFIPATFAIAPESIDREAQQTDIDTLEEMLRLVRQGARLSSSARRELDASRRAWTDLWADAAIVNRIDRMRYTGGMTLDEACERLSRRWAREYKGTGRAKPPHPRTIRNAYYRLKNSTEKHE